MSAYGSYDEEAGRERRASIQSSPDLDPAPKAPTEKSNSAIWIFVSVLAFFGIVGVATALAGSSSSANPFEDLEDFCADVPGISQEEFLARGVVLQEAMEDHGIDVYMTEPGASMIYFSDLSWGLSERPFLYIKKVDGENHLLIPEFELETVEELLKGSPLEEEIAAIHTWAEQESPYTVLFQDVLNGDADLKISMDPQIRFFIQHGLQTEMNNPSNPIDSAFEMSREIRMVKSEAELNIMRCVNRGTKAAIQALSEILSESTTEDRATDLLNAGFRAAGLQPEFALVAFGKNAAYPHGSQLRTTLKKGDFILIDAGASLHGYVSDVTRTFPYHIKALSEKQREIWDLVQEAQRTAIELVRPGTTCAELDAAARKVITDRGYGDFFGHRLGHGIGLEVHEEPYLVGNNAETVLEENMTFTIEPGVYLVGELGVRHEDVIRVTADGYEVLGKLMESVENPFPEED